MSQLSEAELTRNVRLQVILRVFQKRVFLPLAAIYFTTVAGFSLSDIGLLAFWFAAIQVVAEVPTGMFADRYGKVTSERLGAAMNVCATLLYVFAPSKLGIFAGMALEAIGYSFFGGACEALLHDTLHAQGRVDQYTKMASRIQSVSLAINAVLLALVPMTYRIDPRYPFMLGTLAYAILLASTFFLKEVYPHKPRTAKTVQTIGAKITILKLHRKFILFLLTFGIISALYTAPSDFVNLALRDLGLQPQRMGILFAAASLAGVVFGWFLHLFKRFPFRVYALTDWFMLFIWLASVWTNRLWVLMAAYVITMAFWRYRRIIYQEKLLNILQTNKKATALSVMNNAGQLNELYIPLLFGFGAAAFGIPKTFGLAAIASVGLLFLWLAALRTIPLGSVPTAAVSPEV